MDGPTSGLKTDERLWTLCTTEEKDRRFDLLAPEFMNAEGVLNKTALATRLKITRQTLYTYMYDREARDKEDAR